MIFFLFLLAQPDPGEVDPGSAERDALRERLSDDRSRSSSLRKEEATILDALLDLDRALADQRKKTVELSREQAKLLIEVRALDLQIADAVRRFESRKSELTDRAHAMMRLSKMPIVDVLARARTPSEARKLRARLRIVLGHDAVLVKEARAAKEEAREKKLLVEAARRDLANAQRSLGEEEDKTRTLREERRSLLDAVTKERRSVERLVAEIERAQKRLELQGDVVRGVLPPPAPAPGGFAKQRGRLLWPVAGRVDSVFGKRVEPESKIVLDHPGIDVRAPYGESVRAVFDGEVVLAEDVRGFGRAVALDHGDGFLTVYGHLESIDVELGQRVEREEAIGTLGESGSWKGPFLYFEVRRHAGTEDPMTWLAP